VGGATTWPPCARVSSPGAKPVRLRSRQPLGMRKYMCQPRPVSTVSVWGSGPCFASRVLRVSRPNAPSRSSTQKSSPRLHRGACERGHAVRLRAGVVATRVGGGAYRAVCTRVLWSRCTAPRALDPVEAKGANRDGGRRAPRRRGRGVAWRAMTGRVRRVEGRRVRSRRPCAR
jgi:hypothetical protein